jgi:hypothetical protein
MCGTTRIHELRGEQKPIVLKFIRNILGSFVVSMLCFLFFIATGFLTTCTTTTEHRRSENYT